MTINQELINKITELNIAKLKNDILYLQSKALSESLSSNDSECANTLRKQERTISDLIEINSAYTRT